MGVATPTPPPPLVPPILSKPTSTTTSTHPPPPPPISFPYGNNPSKSTNYHYSMSQQDYHHHQANILSFSNGFERSQQEQHHQQQPHHLTQQIRGDKLRGYDHPRQPPLVGIEGEAEEAEEEPTGTGFPVYETAGMLSEMFNFPTPPPGATGDLIGQSTLHPNYRPHPRHHQQQLVSDWYTNNNRQQADGLVVSGLMGPLTNLNDESSKSHHQNDHHIPGINADSAAAMQLFLMNPHQARSPSPAPPPPSNANSSTLHMLLPNPSGNSLQGFSTGGGGPFGGPQFTWGNEGAGGESSATNTSTTIGMENQGLSLSLSSHLEAAKAEEFGMGGGDGGFLYGAAAASSSGAPNSHHQLYKGLGLSQHHQHHHQALHLQGTLMGQSQSHLQHHHHFGFGGGSGVSSSASTSSLGVVNVLRNSKYVKAAQELLEEFCSVGRGQFKKSKLMGRNNANPSTSSNNNNNSNSNNPGGGNSGGNGSSSSTRDLPPLSAADRIEHQRRKVKLLSMLDEVDRRYNHYCEQMQMVVNSFDLVMGFGSAVPYTALAQKAMSRHFRCLKDSIAAQLKHSCELLGEKDAAGTLAITKGETPRLKLLEQSLRQQRAFHQMGMMEQEAWRPQRGLPERSVNILRAWLFEHFLHPYPSDADKHLLARQTGLSRNQVSNWFINARVRLWKPMVEEMYQKENKDEESTSEEKQPTNVNNSGVSQTPTPTTTTATSPPPPITSSITPINANIQNDPSLLAMDNKQRFYKNQSMSTSNFLTPTNIATIVDVVAPPPFHDLPDDVCHRSSIVVDDYAGATSSSNPSPASVADTITRFGTAAAAGGDVSLTLGLRHAGNMPEKGSSASTFSVRDFGSC